MADFKLGRIKFKWRGNWATSTAYLIDDVVKYGGNSYVAVTNHTSQGTSAGFYTDIAKWSLQAESIFSKGNYQNSTHYKLNDLVKYGNRQYRCTTQHTSSSTVLDTSKFELYLDGTDYKGDYAVSTYYKVNDIVKYGGGTYICITAHTSSGSAGAFDETKFNQFTDGLQFEDSWSTSTVYQKGDVVTYGGYSYVSTVEHNGVTPIASASQWDLLSPGFNAVGVYNNSTAYKTGDVVEYGGYSFVNIVNSTGQKPMQAASATVNTSYWQKLNEGFSWKGTYNSGVTYLIGEVVEYSSSSYVMIVDSIVGVTPGTDAAKWQLVAQGSTTNVLTTRGDIIVRDASQTNRLPIGTAGSFLTTDGTDVVWSNAESGNVKWVSNSGSNSNPGTEALPYKTVNYGVSQLSSGDIIEVDTIAGGTGGTPGTFDVVQASTTGSGTGFKARVVLDGSSTPVLTITDGGSGHAEGDDITITGVGSPSASSNITFNTTSVSVGDVLYIKNGVYKESLPLVIPAGCTVQGESLRGTEIRPGTSTGTQVKTFTQSGGTAGTAGTYNYVHQSATNGNGKGFVCNVVQTGSGAPTVTIYNGGYGFAVGNTITIPANKIGTPGSGALTITVASLEDNNASNMWLLNNQTNLVQMSFKGLTGTPGAGGTGKAAVTSLDPSGSITTASPYIQNCSSVNANATGIQIDGNLHAAGNKSILANDYTQINSDGMGVHALARGRGEMVSIFTYYCDKSFYAHSGGFIRGLNCSSAYGEKGCIAEGTDASETATSVLTRGEMLKYDATSFQGAATESDIANMIATSGSGTATLTGVTSGATATIFRVNISLDYLHITGRVGNFQQDERVTITKEDSSTFQVDLSDSFGDSSAASAHGQVGPLIAVYSTDSTLASANVLEVGSNILFAGDSKYYRISAVSEENTTAKTALIRLTESVTSANAKANATGADVTENFSNVRVTGHDFLDVGTGDFTTSNYPGTETQVADQADEVEELTGGRVYFTSSDQDGDFRVGDLFRIQQSTGIATLNADAFDLSGLNELQLGSIGAELGSTINEFSSDETLSGDANSAVPTERAIVGYTQRDQMGTGHLVPPTGTTSERPTGSNLKTGGIRYNSSLVTWEGYNGTQWTGLGGGNPWASTSSSITVAANDRYFVDTSGAAKTMTLPASPQVGDQVSFVDLAGTFDTNNLTIARNSLKIMGQTADMTVSTEDAGVQLVYTGSTYGWKLVQNI